MRRILAGLFVTTLGLATFTLPAEAHRDGRFWKPAPRICVDPVFLALQRCSRIRLNNYFDGRCYRTSGRWFDSHDVRLVGRNHDGTYDIRFCGKLFRAYARDYRGKLCLYLGHAPTGPGYAFELVVG